MTGEGTVLFWYFGTRHTLCLGRDQSCFGTLGLVIHYVWGGTRVGLILRAGHTICMGRDLHCLYWVVQKCLTLAEGIERKYLYHAIIVFFETMGTVSM